MGIVYNSIFTQGNASRTELPVGTNVTNTYEAMDDAGNTATCSFEVIVEDREDPVISCPGDIVLSADEGQCSTMVSYDPPTSTDNCIQVSMTQIAVCIVDCASTFGLVNYLCGSGSTQCSFSKH